MFSERKLFLFVLTLVFLWINIGGALSTGMMMQDGKMQNCPFMGVTTVCKMSVFEHLAIWQGMFSSIPVQLVSLVLYFFLSLFLLTRLLDDFFVRKRSLVNLVFYRWREVEIFDPLRLAFARGLIHPKIF